jgi:hypothetical protein
MSQGGGVNRDPQHPLPQETAFLMMKPRFLLHHDKNRREQILTVFWMTPSERLAAQIVLFVQQLS